MVKFDEDHFTLAGENECGRQTDIKRQNIDKMAQLVYNQ